MMNIDKVFEAYSGGDDESLCKELRKFLLGLYGRVHCLGVSAVILQLSSVRGRRRLFSILNKIAAEADGRAKPGMRLAYVAGSLTSYLDYFESIVDRQAVDTADAQLSNLPEDKNNLRMMILKSVFSHVGMGSGSLLLMATRIGKISKRTAKTQLRKLLDIGLIEKILLRETLEARQGVVHYRITRLGENVLMRRSLPHELALFCIDMAASDPELRAAMKDKIKDTWPLEDLTVPDAEMRAITARRNETKRMFPLEGE